jgi:hypothetical protein
MVMGGLRSSQDCMVWLKNGFGHGFGVAYAESYDL